jgi:putative hydrolase
MRTTASRTDEENRQIASCLREAAQRLADQGANPFRAGTYRAAADTIDDLDSHVRTLFDTGGIDALVVLPHVGAGIAQAIAEMLITRRWRQLERLRGDARSTVAFEAVPGIGHELTLRIQDTLHIDTLEDLDVAARDGRLETVSGVGPRRAAGIRAALDDTVSRRRRWHCRPSSDGPATEPSVAMLLDIDRVYRERAAAGALPMIAPKRPNLEGHPPLPLLHVTNAGWHFTAMYAYAYVGRTQEPACASSWVVVYFYDDTQEEHQRTVVTETHGTLTGKRVVRGREMACRAFYRG